MQVALYESDLPVFCAGDFKTSDYKETRQMDSLGCKSIPLSSAPEFGTVAGQIPIPRLLQESLISLYLWKTLTEKTVTPAFCMAMRTPTKNCSDFTFGMAVNVDTILALSEVLPATGAGDALLAFTRALMEGRKLKQLTVAFSSGDGLEVPVGYYTDRSFVKDNFYAHFYFSYEGGIDLPNFPGNGKDIVKVEGPYSRSLHLGTTQKAAEKALDEILDSSKMNRFMKTPDVMSYFESAILKFPEVIATDASVVVDLDGITGGLLKGFTIDGAQVMALKLPKKVGDIRPGFYMSGSGQIESLKPIAQGLCEHLDGAMKAVSGRGCPDLLGTGPEGKLGFELRKNAAELVIQWPNFFLRCRVHNIYTSSSKMNCQVDSVIFAIIEKDTGYLIGKNHALTGMFDEMVASVSKDAVKAAKGFGGKIAMTPKLDAMKETGKALNFEDKNKCKESLRLWSSRARNDYSHYFSQSGNDDSKSSCFESCYEWYETHPQYMDDSLCCSYEILHTSRGKRTNAECRVGHKGRVSVNDQRKTASVSFVEDYDRMASLPLVGSRCFKDEDCFSGFCHDSQCKNKCDLNRKCFASPFSKCFGQHDACINTNGISHWCDTATDACTSSEASGQTTVLPELNLDLFASTAQTDKLAPKQKTSIRQARKRIRGIVEKKR